MWARLFQGFETADNLKTNFFNKNEKRLTICVWQAKVTSLNSLVTACGPENKRKKWKHELKKWNSIKYHPVARQGVWLEGIESSFHAEAVAMFLNNHVCIFLMMIELCTRAGHGSSTGNLLTARSVSSHFVPPMGSRKSPPKAGLARLGETRTPKNET